MKKTLRIVAVVLMLAMVVSMFAACDKKTEDPANTASPETSAPAESQPPKDVTLNMMTYMTGEDAFTSTWKDLQKKYMEENPHVKIVDQSVPAADDVFKNRINADFAAGNAPDVTFAFTGAQAQPIIDSGKLYEWDQEIGNDADWAGNFLPGVLDGAKHDDGKTYGIPIIGFFEAMYYNKELFTNNDIKVPTTYEELLTAVEAFKAKDITPIAVSFMEEPHYMIETFILNMGGKAGHSTPWDASWAEGLNYIKDLYEKGAFPANTMTLKSGNSKQLFIDQKAAMMIEGSWTMGAFKNKENAEKDITAKVGVMPVPALPGAKGANTVVSGYGSGWYVNKTNGDDKLQEGIKFVKWITSPEQEKEFLKVGGTPATKGSAPSDLTLVEQEAFKMLEEVSDSNKPIDKIISQEAFGKIWRSLGDICTGKKTAQQVIDEAKALN